MFSEPKADACVALISLLQNPHILDETYCNATVIIKPDDVLQNRKSQRTIFAMT